jgi:selenocysteine lyase/cysteine desulfurase
LPFTLLFPTTHAEIIAKFTEHLRALPKAEGKKTVAIIDTIVANPGVLLPWQEMVKICKEQDVWSVVDAAHSIGQEMNINLSQAQPDFWVSVRS